MTNVEEVIKLLSPATIEAPIDRATIDIQAALVNRNLLNGGTAAGKLLDLISALHPQIMKLISGQGAPCQNNLNSNACVTQLANVISGSSLGNTLKDYFISGRNCGSSNKQNYAVDIVSHITSNLTNIIQGCNNSNISDPVDKAYCIVMSILKEIPRAASRTYNRSRHGDCTLQANLLWLLDTCYDADRIRSLLRSLHDIRRTLEGSNGSLCDNRAFLFRNFLLLTIGAYTAAVVKPNEVSKFDWYLSLVHAASSKALPLCPSRGDVAALVYLARICGITSSVAVRKDKVKEILVKLLGLQ